MASDKEKQIRMTLQDCLYNQGCLREMLKILISENRPLAHKERQEFYNLLPKALISQGATNPVYFVHNNGWFIFASIQNLAHRLADLQGNKIKLKTSRPENVEVVLPISELWKVLYEKVLFLFPMASAEAIHISAETVERPQQGAFSFSSKEELNDRK
jgi:hypothetical protein